MGFIEMLQDQALNVVIASLNQSRSSRFADRIRALEAESGVVIPPLNFHAEILGVKKFSFHYEDYRVVLLGPKEIPEMHDVYVEIIALCVIKHLGRGKIKTIDPQTREPMVEDFTPLLAWEKGFIRAWPHPTRPELAHTAMLYSRILGETFVSIPQSTIFDLIGPCEHDPETAK